MYEPFLLDECERKLNLITRQDILTHSSVSSEIHIIELLEHLSIIITYPKTFGKHRLISVLNN